MILLTLLLATTDPSILEVIQSIFWKAISCVLLSTTSTLGWNLAMCFEIHLRFSLSILQLKPGISSWLSLHFPVVTPSLKRQICLDFLMCYLLQVQIKIWQHLSGVLNLNIKEALFIIPRYFYYNLHAPHIRIFTLVRFEACPQWLHKKIS